MSWFKKAGTGLILLALLCGCGFTPVHGETGTYRATERLQTIEVADIPNRDGLFLRNQLIDRLYAGGSPAAPSYRLQIFPLRKQVVSFGIRKDATSTRGQLEIETTVRLTDKTSGALLLERDFRAVGGFNRLDNQLATLTSEQDLTENILAEMSEDILTTLSLYFTNPTRESPL